MDKAKQVFYIVGATILVYVFILAIWGIMIATSGDTAAALAVRPTIDQYWELVAAVNVVPWILFFVPAVLGGAMVVFVLRQHSK